jgi:hypothetical protein
MALRPPPGDPSVLACSAEPRPGQGRFLAQNPVAQIQALVTDDPRVTGRCHARDLVALLPAEAALLRPGVVADRLDRGDVRADRMALPG